MDLGRGRLPLPLFLEGPDLDPLPAIIPLAPLKENSGAWEAVLVPGELPVSEKLVPLVSIGVRATFSVFGRGRREGDLVCEEVVETASSLRDRTPGSGLRVAAPLVGEEGGPPILALLFLFVAPALSAFCLMR